MKLSDTRHDQIADGRTLADTLCCVISSDRFTVKSRKARKKSFNSFARVVGRRLNEIHESLDECEALIATADHKAAGIGEGTWRTVKSHIRAGLRLNGFYYTSGRNVAALTTGWYELFQTVSPKKRSRVYPIGAVMTAIGIEPADVAQAHMPVLWEKVADFYPGADPHEKARVAVAVWNELTELPQWPKTILQPCSLLDRTTYPETRFSMAFRNEVEAIERDVLSPRDGKLDRRRPRLRDTAKDWRDTIYEVASAYCRRRRLDPSSLLSARQILTWQVLEDAVLYWQDRRQIDASPNLERRAILFRAIARRHTSQSKRALEKFDKIIDKVTPSERPPSTTRDLILRLKDPVFRTNLLLGPERVISRELAKPVPTPRSASTASKASAWALLMAAPLAMNELVSMLVGEQLPESGEGVKVVVEYSPTRRDVMPIPARTVQLIIACQSRFGHLWRRSDDLLFAGRSGAKRPANLGKQVSDLISAELLCRVTAGQLCFLMAGIYLYQHPHDFETIRRYLRWRTAEAVQEYFGFLVKDRAAPRFVKKVTSAAV